MSVYSDAVEKLGVEVGSFVEGWIGAFLRYLPPSIVVDGRVVELADLYRGRYVNHEELVEDLIAAAREVAGRES